MNSIQVDIIESIKVDIIDLFLNDFSGHDTLHSFRVLKNAEYLHYRHGGDLFIISLAALLHDTDDKKIFPDTYKDKLNAVNIMKKYNIKIEEIEKVIKIISTVSFSEGKTAENIEEKIVQDADRLDALGAIGIARCFAFGGNRNRSIYNNDDFVDNNIFQSDSSISHFFVKLLKLENLMNTESAKQEARKRTEFIKKFLLQFFNEIMQEEIRKTEILDLIQ